MIMEPEDCWVLINMRSWYGPAALLSSLHWPPTHLLHPRYKVRSPPHVGLGKPKGQGSTPATGSTFTPTPCPGTGTHHVWDPKSHYFLDEDWIEVTCPECEWVALGLLVPNTNDQLDVLVADGMYDENPKGVSMWRETIRSHNPFPHLVSSSGKLIGPSLLPTPIVNYHTHSKAPTKNVAGGVDWLI